MTGPELRAWREHWRLSQAGLAAALGMHINTIGQWERGQRAIPALVPLALETLDRRQAAELHERARGPVLMGKPA